MRALPSTVLTHPPMRTVLPLPPCARVAAQPDRLVLVFLDDITIGWHSTVSVTFFPRGADQPRAHRSHAADPQTLVVTSLDDQSGRVVVRRASKIRVETQVPLYHDLRAAYPQAERIDVGQDNWPVHTHPDVLVALEPQTSPFPIHRPPNWPITPSGAAVRRWGQLNLPIPIVPLPTYASWCNPIEQQWRKLRHEGTHLHHWADDLVRLRAAIDLFLAQFATGSTDLLRYVGLSTECNV